MDPYDNAPAIAAITEQHAPAAEMPACAQPASLPVWRSGGREFASIDHVMQVDATHKTTHTSLPYGYTGAAHTAV